MTVGRAYAAPMRQRSRQCVTDIEREAKEPWHQATAGLLCHGTIIWRNGGGGKAKARKAGVRTTKSRLQCGLTSHSD